MRALIVTAGVFFALFGGTIAYFAASDSPQEFDLKYVLPVDTRQMPVQPPLPEVAPLGQAPAEAAVTDGRAETGRPLALPARDRVRFGERDGAASEAPQ